MIRIIALTVLACTTLVACSEPEAHTPQEYARLERYVKNLEGQVQVLQLRQDALAELCLSDAQLRTGYEQGLAIGNEPGNFRFSLSNAFDEPLVVTGLTLVYDSGEPQEDDTIALNQAPLQDVLMAEPACVTRSFDDPFGLFDETCSLEAVDGGINLEDMNFPVLKDADVDTVVTFEYTNDPETHAIIYH